jgi:hypothetical protein
MKIAIVIYAAPTELARGFRALMNAQELKEAGDDVVIVFDGSGVESAAAFADSKHQANAVFESVRDRIQGACSFCASMHRVKDQLEAAGIPLLADHNGHASLRKLMMDGYQILTF